MWPQQPALTQPRTTSESRSTSTSNLVGTAAGAFILVVSATYNGFISIQTGDAVVAWLSAAQLLVTLVFLVLTASRWKKRRRLSLAR